MTRCLTTDRSQIAVDELNFEARRRTAVFQSPRQLMGYVFQQVADRIDAAYQPKPGYQYQWRIELTRDCLFGSFQLQRNYYSHEGRHLGHYPTAAALGLEGGKPPALARLVGFKGADQDSYQKAEEQLKETGGIQVLARRIQRRVQPVGAGAQPWQERAALAPLSAARPVPILHVSADATGVPRRKEALAERPGQQPDGRAKTRSAYLGCIFPQHKTDEKGSPVRDCESATYVSNLGALEDFDPVLRQAAIRRGLGQAPKVGFSAVLSGIQNCGRRSLPAMK
jgi:hypothetical protein